MKCPDCSKEVSDKADKCGNCGYPIAKQQLIRENSDTTNHQAIAWLVFIGIIVLAIVVNSFLVNEPKENSELRRNESVGNPTKWYQGGTLHRASIEEYWSATESNRLATCADFATLTLKDKVNPTNWEDKVLERATAIKACIDTATEGLPQTQDMKVSEVAAMCTTQLGYQ